MGDADFELIGSPSTLLTCLYTGRIAIRRRSGHLHKQGNELKALRRSKKEARKRRKTNKY